ncbi:MAG: hypothetical protein NUW37_15780 [Planctomycetes bacterium]|nr:hypothetical protein [Planctomycetota bacterium]
MNVNENNSITTGTITNFDGRIDQDAAEFIVKNGLEDSARWLCTEIPRYFENDNFVFTIVPSMDIEDGLLTVVFFGNHDVGDFSERRFEIMTALRDYGHEEMYMTLGITQRGQP